MNQFTTEDRNRWFARYGDDYATPELAEADYAEYLAERDLARSIMAAADEALDRDLESQGDLRHVLSPEHVEQLSGDDMQSSAGGTYHPAWCVEDRCYEGLDGAAIHNAPCAGQDDTRLVEVTQVVEWVGVDVFTMPAGVTLWWDGSEAVAGVSASECRDLAAALIAGAESLDAIEASRAA